MKWLLICLCILLFFESGITQIRQDNQLPVFLKPTPHERDLKTKLKKLPTSSFYQSKANWQTIIDSTWGLGAPLDEKLNIFNTYTKALSDKFDGFLSLGIDQAKWDLIKNSYLTNINDSTSHGAFAAIMSRLAYDFYDCHTYAYDSTILLTPLNPVTPVLVIGSDAIEHFGAVLTLLPDSSIAVLRVIDDHPLGLKPGDIIVGYEGIPWKDLLHELLDAGLPILASQKGAKSAARHSELVSVGMNWHLFESIDIKKYGSNDTTQLSVYPLLDLPQLLGWYFFTDLESGMLSNEQLPVEGIEFPEYSKFKEQGVFYGKIENTNVGYIYLCVEIADYHNLGYLTDNQFYEAIVALMNTDALIIDIRLNFGGWSLFMDAFGLLFNEFHYTIEDAYRCSADNFNLCSINNKDQFKIPGNYTSIYDRPIAVLVGPQCVSMGDITAQRLIYHPMVRFFGKSTCSSLGDNVLIESFPKWILRYSVSDMFHISNPHIFLNRSEFPVDDPVWFDREDIVKGKDTVVEKALEWINNLSHAHNVTVNKSYFRPGQDSVTISAEVKNPNNHDLKIMAYISSDNDFLIDSLQFNPGLEGEQWHIQFKASEENAFHVSVKTEDLEALTSRTLPNVVHFTSIGPVVLDHYRIVSTSTNPDTIPGAGDQLRFEFTLRNDGQIATAKNVMAKLKCLAGIDTAEVKGTIIFTYQDIEAGQMKTATQRQYIKFADSLIQMGQVDIPFRLEIYSNGILYWSSDFTITDLGPEKAIRPEEFALYQNFPNPFNPVTAISYQLPAFSQVDLSIYNLLGQKVATLVSAKQPAGKYEVQWDATGFASGVYLYKLTTDQGFTQTKKLVLLR